MMRGSMVVFHAEKPEPELREFDRALTLEELQGAVGGYVEAVPGFRTIAYCGVVLNCVALANEDGKSRHLPINHPATLAWGAALKRAGQELADPSGIPKDWLVGDVAVVFGDREFMREL